MPKTKETGDKPVEIAKFENNLEKPVVLSDKQQLELLQKFPQFIPFLEAVSTFVPVGANHPIYSLIYKLNEAKNNNSLESLTYVESVMLKGIVENSVSSLRRGNITIRRNISNNIKQSLAWLEITVEEEESKAEASINPLSVWG